MTSRPYTKDDVVIQEEVENLNILEKTADSLDSSDPNIESEIKHKVLKITIEKNRNK